MVFISQDLDYLRKQTTAIMLRLKKAKELSHHSETDPAVVAEGEGAVELGGQLGAVDVLVQRLEGGQKLKLQGRDTESWS